MPANAPVLRPHPVLVATSRFAGLALSLALWTLPVSAAYVLQVGGTGGASALMAHLGKPFTQQTGIAVDIIPSLGSGGGISSASDGVLDIAFSGRPLSPAEQVTA